MEINLQNNVTSPQELKALILEVRGYSHWFGQNSVKMRLSKSNPTEQFATSQVAAVLINEWIKDNPLSQKSLDKLLSALEDLLEKSPRITITLAAPAPGTLKKTLVVWCRENINPSILVDFRFNSTLLGGMTVQYGSHIYDWSFRRQILAARQRFPEVLRHV